MGELANFFSFLIKYARTEAPTPGIGLSRGAIIFAIVISLIAGLGNAAFLALINHRLANTDTPMLTLAWAFGALCLLLPLSRYLVQMLFARLSEGAAMGLRIHLSRQILELPLRRLEDLGQHRLLATLADDVAAITGSVTTLPQLSMQLALILGCLIYLGYLSWLVLLVFLGFMLVGTLVHQVLQMRATRHLAAGRESRDVLFQHFMGLTQGAKELKLHHARRVALLTERLKPTTEEVGRHQLAARTLYLLALQWGQILFFVLIGLIVFVLPRFREVSPEVLTGYAMTILFIIGPLGALLNLLPNLGRGAVSVRKIQNLGLADGLARAGDQVSPAKLPPADLPPEGQTLELNNVLHRYGSGSEFSSFELGPLNLTFEPGQLTFIIGGNGSGKTTLAKLIIGLYLPTRGQIQLGDQPIADHNQELYQQNFSVVFSDFFLFESLLDLANPELDTKAQRYLKELQIDHKVEVVNGKFSTIDLSLGQRKRLALLLAYLEDRPFFLFDEWAADQDVEFKEIFYKQMLPELRRRGKSVLVISHDDHYYEVADRIIKLDYGKVVFDGDGPEYMEKVALSAAVPAGTIASGSHRTATIESTSERKSQ